MISNDEQLQQAYEALGDLYRALASYRAKILRVNLTNYNLIAQGPLEEIRRIQSDINAYLGLHESLNASQGAAVLREGAPPLSGGTKQ